MPLEGKYLQRLLWLLHSAGCPPLGLSGEKKNYLAQLRRRVWVELNMPLQIVILPTWVIAIDKGWSYDEDQAQYGETDIEDIKNAKRLLKRDGWNSRCEGEEW